MRMLTWVFRAFIFFTLFAFALNNQQTVTVRWFFGMEWSARMVIVVLAVFAAGCAVGILAMLPARLARKSQARTAPEEPAPATTRPMPMPMPEADDGPNRIRREGL
jgi:uncharacterized integral membrane protein